MDANDRIFKSYDSLSNSFTRRQNDELEDLGFTFLKKRQFKKLMKDQSNIFYFLFLFLIIKKI